MGPIFFGIGDVIDIIPGGLLTEMLMPYFFKDEIANAQREDLKELEQEKAIEGVKLQERKMEEHIRHAEHVQLIPLAGTPSVEDVRSRDIVVLVHDQCSSIKDPMRRTHFKRHNRPCRRN